MLKVDESLELDLKDRGVTVKHKPFPISRCKKRTVPLDLIVGHWTGGEGAASAVYNTLMTRKNKEGKIIGLGVDFIIDREGVVWCCNPNWRTHYTQHAGALFNKRSVGVEIVNYGKGKPNKKALDRTVDSLVIHGRQLGVARFYSVQVDAFYALCRYVCLEARIPFEVMGGTTTAPVADFRGIVGHFHLTKQKDDPGPLLLSQIKDKWHAVSAAHRIVQRPATQPVAQVPEANPDLDPALKLSWVARIMKAFK